MLLVVFEFILAEPWIVLAEPWLKITAVDVQNNRFLIFTPSKNILDLPYIPRYTYTISCSGIPSADVGCSCPSLK